MNSEAKKWMERATAAGDRMATVIDHVTANNLNMTAMEWCAVGQLFADLARLAATGSTREPEPAPQPEPERVALKRLHPGLVIEPVDQQEEG